MHDIIFAIYEMMGKYSEPTGEDISPREHAERVFQKMDLNNDGMITVDEFMDCCKRDVNISQSMSMFDTVI